MRLVLLVRTSPQTLPHDWRYVTELDNGDVLRER